MDLYGHDPSREVRVYWNQKRQRRRDFYSTCRDGRKEQASKKFQAEKTRELLRCVYPANPSGSKVISLGLDPVLDFQPVVNLYKAGFPGVKFASHAFDELCHNADFIRNYFQGVAAESGQLQISDTIIMKFISCFGKPAVEFISDGETDNERRVVLTVETWLHIYDMLPLLRRVFHSLAEAASHVSKLYSSIVDHTNTNYHLKSHEPSSILQDVKNYLYALNPDVMTKEMPEEARLDKFRVFYELIHFCLYDIASGIRLSL